MNYPIVLASIAFLSLGACKHGGATVDTSLASVGDHYTAKHCEIFVDKVQALPGPHGIREVQFEVRLLKFRLDGEVDEVGVRMSQTVKYLNNPGQPYKYPWVNVPLNGSEEDRKAGRYFWQAQVGSDDSETRSEAVFYVRTRKGTTYWAKPEGEGNFQVEQPMFTRIRDLYRAGVAPDRSPIGTESQSELTFLNPGRCDPSND